MPQPPRVALAVVTRAHPGGLQVFGLTGGIGSGKSTVAQLMAARNEPFAALQLGVNYKFGDNEDEPVILIGLTPELVSLRMLCNRFSKSSYSEFRPHIAVPDIQTYLGHGWKIPRHIYFNKISVWLDSEGDDLFLGTGTPA